MWEPTLQETLQEATCCAVTELNNEKNCVDRLVSRISCKTRLERTMAWCLSFVHNCRHRKERKTGDLMPDEIDAGLAEFIRNAQEIAFQQDLLLLKKNLPLPGSSKLKQFSPFVDVKRYGVLRVGGRLKNAPVDYETHHPILLPSDQQITDTIIWDHHHRNGHLKTEQLFHSLRSSYWILSARRVIRRQVKICVPCKRREIPVP